MYSPNTAIVNYLDISKAMAADLVAAGVSLFKGQKLLGVDAKGEFLELKTS